MSKEIETLETIDKYYKYWFEINNIYHNWSRKHNIEDTVLFVLTVIREEEPYCTQNKICEKLVLPKQTISLVLQNLERKGYILREKNSDDRRNKNVKFTENGKSYAIEILDKLKFAEIRALSEMSQEQIGRASCRERVCQYV